MKRTTLITIALLGISTLVKAQFCDPNGNIAIYSNYDGGMLKIGVDMNIPNLKIGIVSYETDCVMIVGPFVNNITRVWYAGYDATNNHCSFTNPTSITGAPFGTDTIVFSPAATLNNSNGNPNIICNYACDDSTNQGGCNTPDQIVDYFLNVFGGGSLLFHRTQYGCWNTGWAFTDGGNCCIGPTVPLSGASISVQSSILCFGDCTSQAEAFPSGGESPFSYNWSNSQTTKVVTNLCAGTYTVTVTDNVNDTATATVTITEPPQLVGSIVTSNDNGNCNGTASINASGGTPTYSYQWDANTGNQTTQMVTGLCAGSYCITVTDINACTVVVCDTVDLTTGMQVTDAMKMLQVYPNPNTGNFTLSLKINMPEPVLLEICDLVGRRLLSESLILGHGQFDHQINLGDTKGVYLLNVIVGGNKYIRKIFVL